MIIAALLFACQASVFPPATKSLRFLQTEDDKKAEMTWSDRRVDGDRMQWEQTFAREGGSTNRSVETFRCSAKGITPIAEGTTFTGVQYGTDLTPGATWNWTWAGTGISAKYVYRVVGREKVTVPAGTFDAIRVDYTAEVLSQTRGKLPIVRGSLWIANDVGLVKQFDDDPEAVFGGKTTLELLSRLPESSPPSRSEPSPRESPPPPAPPSSPPPSLCRR
jgi:hypothetical protein